jgi:group I intron endonuclease
MYGVVYKITNLIDDKLYFGQTTGKVSVRWNSHIANKSCKALCGAIEKYGKENFKIEIILRCNNKEELDARESFCIRIFNSLAPNGYNLLTGGSNGKHHEDTKKKMSALKKGKPSPFKGKKRSEEAVKKNSIGHIGLPSPQRKSVLCLTNGVIYESASHAAKELKLDNSYVSKVCVGRLKQAKGFTFKYLE